jgi:cardiolipin synthase (CMP-forming)
MRLSPTGVVAGAVYLGLGLGWVFAGQPPGPAALEVAWIAAVAAGGAFVPGLANQVSLSRAYLAAPALAYSLAPGQLGLLAVTVALAGLSDLVDGTVARRMETITSLGGGLDPVVDGIFLGAVAVGLAAGGAFPLWLAAVVVARYLLPALAGGTLLAMRRPIELRHTLTGQVSTSLNLILLGGIALFRGLDQDSGNLVIGSEIVIPIATAATFVHLALSLRRPTVASVGGPDDA